MKDHIEAVVFDFDYTLADSSRAVVACVSEALQGMGLPPASPDEIRRTIGLSLPDTLARLAGEQHRHRAEEFRRLFRRRSDQVMVAWTDVYPATPGAVGSLRGRGLRTGIVSTKFRYRIEAVLQREGLADSFDAVIGGEDVDAFKPDPQGLLVAMERLGAAGEKTLYVGDSLIDAETARRAGVAFLAVISGVTRAEEFNGYRPQAVLGGVGDLPAWFAC